MLFAASYLFTFLLILVPLLSFGLLKARFMNLNGYIWPVEKAEESLLACWSCQPGWFQFHRRDKDLSRSASASLATSEPREGGVDNFVAQYCFPTLHFSPTSASASAQTLTQNEAQHANNNLPKATTTTKVVAKTTPTMKKQIPLEKELLDYSD